MGFSGTRGDAGDTPNGFSTPSRLAVTTSQSDERTPALVYSSLQVFYEDSVMGWIHVSMVYA